MLSILLLFTLLASSSFANDFAHPSIAQTRGGPKGTLVPGPAPAPAPASPPPTNPDATDMDCTTYETIACGGGSALHKGMVYGQNTPSYNMNSIRCNRDLRSHEVIDISTHPGQKRDVGGANNASEPVELSAMDSDEKLVNRDDDGSCDGYMTTLHGALTHCTTFPRAAMCLNLRKDG